MNAITSNGKRLIACIVAALSCNGRADATIFEADLDLAGDKRLTVDTSSGLEWLDLTLTASMSVNQVLSGENNKDYVTKRGFRFATHAEVGDFWNRLGIVIQDGTLSALNDAGADSFIRYLGFLGAGEADVVYSAGFASVSIGNNSTGRAWLRYEYSDFAAAADLLGDTRSLDDTVPATGSFLVRTVPEPNTAAMIILGAGGALFLCRRHRR